LGKLAKPSWRQLLAAGLETQLSARRSWQPRIYAGVHAAAALGAYGWAGLTLATTLGWWGLPLYGAVSLLYNRAFHSHVKERVRKLQPYMKSGPTATQVATLTLPLSEDVGKTFAAAQTGIQLKIGFDDNDGYCQVMSNKQDGATHIAISRNWAIAHHAACTNKLGMKHGTKHFILQQNAILAHEIAHTKAPRWSSLADYGSLFLSCTMALPVAVLAGMAGLLPAAGIATCLLTTGGVAAVILCGMMAKRADEYQADRGAVEEHGTAEHLSGILAGSARPSLRQVFQKLLSTHPARHQRIAAMQAHEIQLTPCEQADGIKRLTRLYVDVARRHQHLFREKPPEATPAGTLTRQRHAQNVIF